MNQFCIIGNPVNHSLSPILYNAAFENLGIQDQYSYDLFHLQKDEIGFFLKKMKKGIIQGASVTIPYKEEILSYVDEISEEVQIINAANTLLLKDENIIGYNTDGSGCVRSFEHARISLQNKNVLLIGAGGTAKAIAASLLKENISKLIIINRTLNRALVLAQNLNKFFHKSIIADTSSNIANYIDDTDILINATSVGMSGLLEKKMPLKASLLHDALIVFESVYTPKKTALIIEAEKKQLVTIEGFNMLLFQFLEQFEILIDKKAPFDICRDALLRQLG